MTTTGLPVTYNHPRKDLLDGGKRSEYMNICVPLYRAIICGDWKAADKILMDGDYYLVRYSITEKKETPLHVAVMTKNIKFVEKLLDKMKEDDLAL